MLPSMPRLKSGSLSEGHPQVDDSEVSTAGYKPVVLVDGNEDIAWLVSAARTTTQTQADQVNRGGRTLTVIVDVTAVGTGSITVAIEAKDPATGIYYALLTGAPLTTNGTRFYVIGLGSAVAGVITAVAAMALPRTWRVKVTANNANPVTYSVGECVTV